MTNRQITLVGWWLFVACAVCFIIAAARAGDMVALTGAVLFMTANIVFMIPFYRRAGHRDHEERADVAHRDR